MVIHQSKVIILTDSDFMSQIEADKHNTDSIKSVPLNQIYMADIIIHNGFLIKNRYGECDANSRTKEPPI